MGKVILDISMSLDGFIAGPNDNPKQGLGEGGEALHDWLFSGELPSKFNEFFKLSSTNKEMFDKVSESTGAMVVGRRTFDLTNGWGGSHPIPDVPVFVVSHSVPDEIMEGSTPFTFVTDGVHTAIEQAKLAAGNKNVSIGTPNVAQQCIKASLVDEILIHLAPVLLGGGKRLFDHIGTEKVQLEKLTVTEATDVTHLRYRILK